MPNTLSDVFGQTDQRSVWGCPGDRHYFQYDKELKLWVCAICGQPR